MSFDIEAIYKLLPAIYRLRDARADGEPGPIKSLIEVIAREVAVIEEDLAQLYDDQFIETCAEWVVPYIGDLLGARGVHSVSHATFSQRAYVANTIGYRRRKGTAAMLEQLAHDVTGWTANVVEFFQLLATTQHLNHIRRDNLAMTDLGQWEPLERLGTPFDRTAHTVDVRRISSRRGRFNIPNIGIFLWRLGANAETGSSAFKVDGHRYLFSPLGNNTPLFTRPETEDTITHLAQSINVPAPISRRVLDDYLDNYYGKGKSLFITIDGKEVPDPQVNETVTVCDLSDVDDGGGNIIWAHLPSQKIAIDPVLGRLAFPKAMGAKDIRVTYHYGFSAEMGGGEYLRTQTFGTELDTVTQVNASIADIQTAIDTLVVNGGVNGVVEINSNTRYHGTLNIKPAAGQIIELRAANGYRPTFALTNAIDIIAADDAEVTINGLLIAGEVKVSGKLRALRLRHCTLVPGRGLTIDGEPKNPGTSSLRVINAKGASTIIELDHCITGPLVLPLSVAELIVKDSIIDALDNAAFAIAATSDGNQPGPQTIIERATIIGATHVKELALASDTIFTGKVTSDRKQEGCVRFSYVPAGSQTPRRYECQPPDEANTKGISLIFNSLRYGEPNYCQLSQRGATEIRNGASDGAEMGAFHDLFQPQRESNLRSRLDEYLRFGLEAGIFYAT
jgi:hypothetical protein